MFRRIQKTTTKSSRKTGGFTLLEIMVSMVLFTIVALSATVTLFHAMRYLARARYRDRAANVLQTVAEQFQSAKVRERLKSGERVQRIRRFFQTTGTSGSDVPTGLGMAWNVNTQTFMYNYSDDPDFPNDFPSGWVAGTDYIVGTAAGLTFRLITAGNNTATDAPSLKLTRRVRYVDPFTGSPADAPANDDYAGYLVQGTFYLEYTYLGQTVRMSTTVLRNINSTDK